MGVFVAKQCVVILCKDCLLFVVIVRYKCLQNDNYMTFSGVV